MDEQELYRQKREAQLAEWEAEFEKLKAKASKASADTQLELNRRIARLEEQLEQGRRVLADMTEAGEGAFESAKERMDDAWSSLKESFEDARKGDADTGHPPGNGTARTR